MQDFFNITWIESFQNILKIPSKLEHEPLHSVGNATYKFIFSLKIFEPGQVIKLSTFVL